MSDVGVVVVDDQEPFRRAARAVVDATSGFRFVGHAGDADEAVAVVRREQPELVLMDVGLPQVDGLEVTRRVRALPEAPVVVLLSTYSMEEIGEDALSCGAAAYLPKERFDSDSLRRVWEEAGVVRD